MTEDEAKTKWCPLARCEGSFAFGNPTLNRRWKPERRREQDNTLASEAHVELPPESLCVASSCMAWRWQPSPALFEQETVTQEQQPAGGGWRPVENYLSPSRPTAWVRDRPVQGIATNGGFCGLAGAPQ